MLRLASSNVCESGELLLLLRKTNLKKRKVCFVCGQVALAREIFVLRQLYCTWQKRGQEGNLGCTQLMKHPLRQWAAVPRNLSSTSRSETNLQAKSHLCYEHPRVSPQLQSMTFVISPHQAPFPSLKQLTSPLCPLSALFPLSWVFSQGLAL